MLAFLVVLVPLRGAEGGRDNVGAGSVARNVVRYESAVSLPRRSVQTVPGRIEKVRTSLESRWLTVAIPYRIARGCYSTHQPRDALV